MIFIIGTRAIFLIFTPGRPLASVRGVALAGMEWEKSRDAWGPPDRRAPCKSRLLCGVFSLLDEVGSRVVELFESGRGDVDHVAGLEEFVIDVALK